MRHLLETAANLSAARDVLQKHNSGSRVVLLLISAELVTLTLRKCGEASYVQALYVIGWQLHFRILHRQYLAHARTGGCIDKQFL
jgi:hypothetical protein